MNRTFKILDDILHKKSVQEKILWIIKDDLHSLGVTDAEYALSTKFIKARKGQTINRVTLFDEGYFYNSFYLEIEKGGFTLKFDDKHDLVKRYGYDNIFGLVEKNRQKIQDIIEHELKIYITKDAMEGL
jgi:hypothetical protein